MLGRAGSSGWAWTLDAIGRENAPWLLLMCLMFFTFLLPSASYIAALSLIQKEWNLNNTQSGAIFSATLAAYAVSALVIIPLTDRFGPRRILLPSVTLAVGANVLFPLVARDLTTAALVQAAAGIGLVGVYMPGVRMIAERFGRGGRGTAVGLFVTALYAAYSASLASTGGLLEAFAWRQAYLTMALISAASIPMAYLLLRNYPMEVVRQSSGRLALRVLRNRPVRHVILGYMLHSTELFTARAWFPAFLLAVLVSRGEESGQAEATAATVAGLALAAGALGPLMGGAISDRLGRVTAASWIFAISGACSWVIGWTDSWPLGLIVALGVVYGWATAADSAVYSAAITEVAEPADLGSTLAVHAFLGFMGGAIGPSAFGAVLDLSPEAHRFGIGFSAVGVLSIVAIAILLRLRSLPHSALVAKGEI